MIEAVTLAMFFAGGFRVGRDLGRIRQERMRDEKEWRAAIGREPLVEPADPPEGDGCEVTP